MKKLVVILVVAMFFFMCSTVFAQTKTEKGQIELGGNASLSVNSFSLDGNHDETITTFSLLPRVGYFVMNKLEIEPQLIIQSVTISPEGGDSHTQAIYGGILSVSYNFESASNLIPFVFGGIGFLGNSFTGATDLKTSLILPSVGGGLKIFISEKGVLRTEAFYQRTTNSFGEDKLTDSGFGISFGFSVFLK